MNVYKGSCGALCALAFGLCMYRDDVYRSCVDVAIDHSKKANGKRPDKPETPTCCFF